MILLITTDGKVYLSYLADIVDKLGYLNKHLQGANTTLCDAKAKIFGFVTFYGLSRSKILSKSRDQFPQLKKCNVTQETNTVIAEHLKMLINNFKERFYDLKAIFSRLVSNGVLFLVDSTTFSRYICSIKAKSTDIM